MIVVLEQYGLAIAVLICLGWQCCFFIVASITKSDKVTDFAYGSNFAGLGVIMYALSGNYGAARCIIVLVLLVLWGLRLALYLLARVLKEGKDARFDGTRDRFFKFMAFWILQFVTVWIISVPFILMFTRPLQPSLTWQDGLGIALSCGGLLLETVADAQKFSFKNAPGNRQKMCTVGLWRISRHPNYFGEALVWWGIWSMCTAAFDGNGNSLMYISVLSPVYVCVILLFLSGIPTLEGPWDKRYGRDALYRHYKKSVPPFVPFIPSIYLRFPLWAKRVFCCEFPLYSRDFPADGDVAAAAGTAPLVGSVDDAIASDFSKAHPVGYQAAAK